MDEKVAVDVVDCVEVTGGYVVVEDDVKVGPFLQEAAVPVVHYQVNEA